MLLTAFACFRVLCVTVWHRVSLGFCHPKVVSSAYVCLCLSVRLSVCLSAGLSVCLSVCLSVYLSVCLSIYLSTYT